LVERRPLCLHQHLWRRTGGKLRDAAVYWAGGSKVVEDKTQEDAAAFGIEIPKEKVEKSDDFEVWDENWDIVMMFVRMQTQWSVSMAGYVGLKYEVLLVPGGLFDIYDVENRREVLEGLRIMESAALTEFHKKSDG
tara:strand:- start:1354 stop:1761 length:408 start_codon:yes stop_codon:yes gene_type:complete